MSSPSKTNWLKIKKAYFSDETLTTEKVAKRFSVPVSTIRAKAQKEGWVRQRQVILAKAEEKMKLMIEDQLAQVRLRHSKIGKLLQKEGIKAIRAGVKPVKPRDALKYTVEGVKIEREAEGLEKKEGSTVNIAIQQQAIMDKYKNIREE